MVVYYDYSWKNNFLKIHLHIPGGPQKMEQSIFSPEKLTINCSVFGGPPGIRKQQHKDPLEQNVFVRIIIQHVH